MKRYVRCLAAMRIAGGMALSAVAVAVGAAMADTVTIAPGNGVFTNVTARIAGETDVEINSGTSGGGIVRLNAANGYVGTTTVNCGTLVVDSVAKPATTRPWARAATS